MVKRPSTQVSDEPGSQIATPPSKRARLSSEVQSSDQESDYEGEGQSQRQKGKQRQVSEDGDEEDANNDEDADENSENEAEMASLVNSHAEKFAPKVWPNFQQEMASDLLFYRELLKLVSLRESKCTSSCAISTLPSILVLRSTSSLVITEVRGITTVSISLPCPYLLLGGKSAVLAAITIVLGGKASFTGRGNGLKTFIRSGQRSIYCVLLNTLSYHVQRCRSVGLDQKSRF
jgi:hypothetical protein